MHRLVRVGTGLLCLTLLASPAVAGPGSPSSAKSQAAPADSSLGLLYSFEHNFGFDADVSKTSPVGFAVDFAKRVADPSPKVRLQAVGEFALNHYSGFTPFAVRGGARFVFVRPGNMTPFVQVLGGVWHCSTCEETLFTLMFGGGAEFAVMNGGMTVRVQFDMPLIFDSVETGIRFSGGIAIPIGKK
jgi:hypothetical protein